MADKYKNKDISTELIDFFPPTYTTRVKQVAKRSRWPFVMGMACAAIVAVGMVIGTGGLVLPKAAFLGTFKAGMSIFVKRVVIGLSSLGGFGIGFGLAQYFGIGKEKPKSGIALTLSHVYSDNDEEFSPEPSRYRHLSKPLPTADKLEIVAHCAAGSWLKLRRSASNRVIEFSRKADETYIPLKNPEKFEFNDSVIDVTHYNKVDKRFLVRFKDTEYKYSQHDLHLLREHRQSCSHQKYTLRTSWERGARTSQDANRPPICYDTRLNM